MQDGGIWCSWKDHGTTGGQTAQSGQVCARCINKRSGLGSYPRNVFNTVELFPIFEGPSYRSMIRQFAKKKIHNNLIRFNQAGTFCKSMTEASTVTARVPIECSR